MNNDTASQHVSPAQSTGNGAFSLALRGLVVCAALLIFAADALLTEAAQFGAYTLLLTGYLCGEMRILWVPKARQFWINPVVLASTFTFLIPFGPSNVIYFLSDVELISGELFYGTTPWMNRLMLYAVLAAVAMWSGYRSSAGRSMGRLLQHSRALRRWMNTSGQVSRRAIFYCLGIGVTARLTAVWLGVYGYSSTYTDLIAAANYTQYLTMAGSLTSLAVLGAAMNLYSSSVSHLVDRQILILVFGVDVLFGFLLGFKTAVVMPLVIVAFVHYGQRNRFPRWLIPGIVVAVIAAYMVIEPFRANRYLDPGFEGTSISSIVAAMPSVSSIQMNEEGYLRTVGFAFLARLNFTYVGSLGIEYAADNKLDEESPAFLQDILFAPAYAFIPRVLWESKSLQNMGLWYTNVVLGTDIESATGMTPVTYLNFCGGPLAIILGFLVLGIAQRGLFDGLRTFGNGGLIVLLGILGMLASIDSAFNSWIIGVIRYVPILIFLQYVLLVRQPR